MELARTHIKKRKTTQVKKWLRIGILRVVEEKTKNTGKRSVIKEPPKEERWREVKKLGNRV